MHVFAPSVLCPLWFQVTQSPPGGPEEINTKVCFYAFLAAILHNLNNKLSRVFVKKDSGQL